MKRVFLILGLIALSLSAWFTVYHMIVIADVGAISEFWHTQRIMAYAAFILAPLVTFLPIAQALKIPLYDLEAVVGWSTLAYVVTFIDPGSQPDLTTLLLLLVSLLMSLATIFTLVSYAFGYRFLSRRSQRYDFLRARREGYLISMFLVGCLLLQTLGVFTLVNSALLALIVVLIEVFLLSRGPSGSGVSSQVQNGSPDQFRDSGTLS